jgi:hypothetical protein
MYTCVLYYLTHHRYQTSLVYLDEITLIKNDLPALGLFESAANGQPN